MLKDRKEKCSKIFITITATIGCFIQLESTFVAYFEYEAVTRSTYVSTKLLEIMSMSICTSYSDIIDYDSIQNLTDINMKLLPRDSRQLVIQDVVTVRNIFDFTPANDTIIHFCELRSISSRVRTQNEYKSCYNFIQIRKYYTQEYMCYVIEPHQYDIPYLTYITSIDSPGEIYSIRIDRFLASKIEYVKIIVHSKKSLPTISKRFSIYTNVVQKDGTLFKVRFSRHHVHYLGYPYDKFTCAPVRGISEQCMESCAINKSVNKFNRIVHDLDIVKKYDFKHISKSQVTNQTISSEVDALLDECSNLCYQKDCDIDYTMTESNKDTYRWLTFALHTPISPDISIIFYPSIKFLDLFVYSMGAIGIWFGFAFINWNPILTFQLLNEVLHRIGEKGQVSKGQKPVWILYKSDSLKPRKGKKNVLFNGKN